MTEVLWWSRLNRRPVILAMQEVVRTGGLVVLSGREEDGLEESAKLAIEELERLGRTCISVSHSGPDTIKQYMLGVLDILRPSAIGAFRPSTVLAGGPTASVVNSLVEELKNSPTPIALIFRGIGREMPVVRGLLRFQQLGERANCPIIVTTLVPVTNSQVSGARIVTLTRFTREEVKECMLAAPELLGMSPDEVERWLDELYLPRVLRIAPILVYAKLQALVT
jgi:hypothetical protein